MTQTLFHHLQPDLRLGSTHKIPTIFTMTRIHSLQRSHQTIVKQYHSQPKLDAKLKHKPYIPKKLQQRVIFIIFQARPINTNESPTKTHYIVVSKYNTDNAQLASQVTYNAPPGSRVHEASSTLRLCTPPPVSTLNTAPKGLCQ